MARNLVKFLGTTGAKAAVLRQLRTEGMFPDFSHVRIKEVR